MNLPRSACWFAVGGLCFVAGVLAERLLFSSSPGERAPLASESSELDPTSSSVHGAPITGLASREGREGNPENVDPVEQTFEQLERGEGIDFVAAVALVDNLPAGDERRWELIHRIASRWGEQDPLAAVEWAHGLEGDERAEALHHIIGEWAGNDPTAVATYVASLPNSERSLDYVHRVAAIWAEHDRAGAVAWGLAQDDPAVRDRALRGALRVWAEEDPAAAAAFAAGLESASARHNLLESVAHRWAEQSTEDALAWAGTLSGGDRTWATRAIFHRLANENPRHAAELYSELAATLPRGSDHDSARLQIARELASRWSEFAPTEAGAWAMTLPEADRVQRSAVREVTERWLRLDSLAASEWVAGLPSGRTRDAAAGQVVEHTARTDPESAFVWATSIGDEGYRGELAHHVLERWRKADPSAARAAFDGAVALSGEQREHIGELFHPESPQAGE